MQQLATSPEDFAITAVVPPGLEEVAAAELVALGAEAVRPLRRVAPCDAARLTRVCPWAADACLSLALGVSVPGRLPGGPARRGARVTRARGPARPGRTSRPTTIEC